MKVKMLTESNIKKLECKVNEFIKDKCIINISHQLVNVNMCNRSVNFLIIIILYDEYQNCGYFDVDSIMNMENNKTN